MRVLLDNCVPARLSGDLPDHQVSHAAQMGWETLQNGVLLRQAEASGYEVLLTVDKNMRYQQSLIGLKICVLTVDLPRSSLIDLMRVSAQINSRLFDLVPGTFQVLKPDL